jgi:hypothetical protein
VADPTQTLQRELLDQIEVWADVETAQAAIDAFRLEYNTNRPHQSLDMAFPADRFQPRPMDERLPLRLPAAVSPAAVSVPVVAPRSAAAAAAESAQPAWPQPGSFAVWADGGDPVNMAVEFTRVVPASGNLAVCGQQFWLGPDRAGATVGFWADTAVVHLLTNGTRLKTVPSRLTVAHLNQLLADGGRPAGPAPIVTGADVQVAAVEVDRLVNATGAVALAGRQRPVGYQFAGQRVTVRLGGGLLQLVADGVLLRSLPNPLSPAELTRLRDARPAGPPPTAPADPPAVERRISARGALTVAGQRIHVGMVHAGRTVTVTSADHTFRVHRGDELLAEVARTTTKPIARFKVRKPERPRQGRPDTMT